MHKIIYTLTFFAISFNSCNQGSKHPIENYEGVNSRVKAPKLNTADEIEIIYRSPDNGITWSSFSKGLGTLNLYTFEVKHLMNGIFAAQWYGIYHSTDKGNNWSQIKNALPDSTAFTTLEVTDYGLLAGIGLRKTVSP